ncbi:cyclopropane-fatty-acyl-phospholipid synthase family protein [Sedimentitalea todarodis]|uniref:Cyclopropane-fatty-acyl-phospholipid synthase family protein n=1 Tax=Sedimentitalea todarodis TaxID=1631240 RepID=A0ABU3VGQ2_9RHOB|nr:cyclopropane-fatty-acyl-phospholipid synthase family protein [Sedimentitalea todarodis]MDU9005363.1 cyclopropane-fatty-acyl-phospholipid synthase family protein [Sedimentitalea todarodis]
MRLTNRALKTNLLSTCARVRDGQLILRTPEGERYQFGSSGPEAEITIHDWAAVGAMAAHGQVGLGETYVQGLWDTPSIQAFMSLVMRNREHLSAYDQASPLSRAKFRMVDSVLRANSRRGARRNIRSHYDVGNEFYGLWLDEGMTYSAGLFADGDTDLARAQTRKNARVLSRLGSGERMLEIGCGWGGLAEQASSEGREVTGVTISPSQHSYADCRLDGRADIQLRDYRDIEGTYDNIVSIEMIEAVGARYWPGYFDVLKRSLAEGGRILLQAITVKDSFFDTYKTSSDFIRQYVFPGGMLLSDRVIRDQAKAAGLEVQDSFAFGTDYGRTCRIWADRLAAQKQRIIEMGYGESFFRNWQYYLESCAASFAIGHTDVVQVELAHA